MEMAGAAARIGEKRKGGGKDSVTSRRAPWPISTPSSTVPPNFKLLLPSASSFVLEKMLIQSGVRTDKGFKEVHLNSVAKGLAEHCGVSVCSTQVYNHLRKWRQRWLTISRLRDLSGAQWCEDTKCIVLEGEHYCGHVADHPKDAEFLNVPIANYDEMHTIFSFGLTTRKYVMRSSEPRADDPQV
ncbi:hypothetical protein QYE76_062328 [Lolium multiflorum]|uniref:Myb/SANT-like domain-containing protein n=1 Tax=Lolium multiflorum TaxID=4521 RepID=A0AAD8W624_LOLMU|nr:hypothetical protein QYE76_062328 [Lolium multiflorum]